MDKLQRIMAAVRGEAVPGLTVPADKVIVSKKRAKKGEASVGGRRAWVGRQTQTYFLQEEGGGMMKVGKAAHNLISTRIGTLQVGNARKLRLVGLVDADIEDDIHRKLREEFVRGEWFRPTPRLCRFILLMREPGESYAEPEATHPDPPGTSDVTLQPFQRNGTRQRLRAAMEQVFANRDA